MHVLTTDLRSRLRYVLHMGLVDIRNVAPCAGYGEQIAHLADVLEFLPKFLDDETDLEPHFEMIVEQFVAYKRRFPDSRHDYVGILEGTRAMPGY
jgi:hypothetical protein